MKRLFFNPDKNKLYIFDCSHVEFFHNNKEKFSKPFDYYIRGLIENEGLYLRLYYPYNDIETKAYTDIKEESLSLLKASKTDILKALETQGQNLKEVFLNVSNQDIKDKFNLLYV